MYVNKKLQVLFMVRIFKIFTYQCLVKGDNQLLLCNAVPLAEICLSI